MYIVYIIYKIISKLQRKCPLDVNKTKSKILYAKGNNNITWKVVKCLTFPMT